MKKKYEDFPVRRAKWLAAAKARIDAEHAATREAADRRLIALHMVAALSPPATPPPPLPRGPTIDELIDARIRRDVEKKKSPHTPRPTPKPKPPARVVLEPAERGITVEEYLRRQRQKQERYVFAGVES